ELQGILDSESVLLALIKTELLELREKYKSPRRTQIIDDTAELRMEDVIPNEGCVITVSHLGFIKRTPVADYRSQKRGGKGVIGCVLTNGANEIVLVSHQGQAVRFFEGAASADQIEVVETVPPMPVAAPEEEGEVAGPKEGLRSMGRFTAGVTGMRFKKKGDY